MLALLDALKNAVEDFATREEKLNQEFETRSTVELNAFESAKLEQQSGQAAELAAAAAALEEDKRQRHTRFDRRKGRINRAHSALSQRVLEEGSEQEGALKQRIRRNSTEAEQRRDADLASAARNFEEFQQKLNENGAEL